MGCGRSRRGRSTGFKPFMVFVRYWYVPHLAFQHGTAVLIMCLGICKFLDLLYHGLLP